MPDFNKIKDSQLNLNFIYAVNTFMTCVGVLCSIPGPGRSPGDRNGNPLQYSCLGHPMDRGAWWATVYGVESKGLLRVGHD